jgi:hypothetical protein
MIDFNLIPKYFVGITILGCLVIGYIIKHGSLFKKIPNNDIPIILAFFGAIFNIIASGLSFENIIYGAIMGLSSTGLHQAFKQFVEGDKK